MGGGICEARNNYVFIDGIIICLQYYYLFSLKWTISLRFDFILLAFIESFPFTFGTPT